MKISPRLKRMLSFLKKECKKEQESPAPCDQNLYSNFYFNISQQQNESFDIQSCDATVKELTEENVRKITKIKRSRSVENWLNDVELKENLRSQEVKNCCHDQISTDLHYACVDVTNKKAEPSNILQSKLFASSSEIFLSYSSFSTFHSSSDSSVGFSIIN